MKKRTPDQDSLLGWDGRDIKRRYETRYWLDGRRREPLKGSKGFPKHEDGSISGAGRVVLRGLASKIQCFDRVTGKVLWTVKKGDKVPGTHIFNVLAFKGDPDQ